MKREDIIQALTCGLRDESWANALWLEGADAGGWQDEYSDFDFWLDVQDENLEESIQTVERILQEIGELDFCYVMQHEHPKIRQRIYHIRGTSSYWMIDFCWQLHSRDMQGFAYLQEDRFESAKVLFDKKEIIRFAPEDSRDLTEEHAALLRDFDYRMSQHVRIVKYIRRNQPIEARSYYEKYALEPLYGILRLKYSPLHADYGAVHLSMQIPKEERERLEKLCCPVDLRQMEIFCAEAKQWYEALRRLMHN